MKVAGPVTCVLGLRVKRRTLPDKSPDDQVRRLPAVLEAVIA